MSLAVFKGHENNAKLLRDAGADLNVRQSGKTLLHNAILRNDEIAIKILGGLGANIETRGQDKRTPLHVAAVNGQVNAIEALAKFNKAKVETRDR